MPLERFLLFLLPVLVLIVAESLWPKRPRSLQRRVRWPGAAIMVLIGTALTRLIAPAGVVGAAFWAQHSGLGMFNFVSWPVGVEILVALALLDFSIWLQHVVLHKVPLLWRFHRVHHADVDLDVTTALRFHPVELLLSFAWKTMFVVAIGASPTSVLIFEVALNLCAMFNHANLAVPKPADRWLRWIIVTPDMHRVHHSTDVEESQRNFGFCLPWWDHVFGVYQAQPVAGHEKMEIGQTQWRGARDQSPWALLKQPWESENRCEEPH